VEHGATFHGKDITIKDLCGDKLITNNSSKEIENKKNNNNNRGTVTIGADIPENNNHYIGRHLSQAKKSLEV
jgi:hypothetical protein